MQQSQNSHEQLKGLAVSASARDDAFAGAKVADPALIAAAKAKRAAEVEALGRSVMERVKSLEMSTQSPTINKIARANTIVEHSRGYKEDDVYGEVHNFKTTKVDPKMFMLQLKRSDPSTAQKLDATIEGLASDLGKLKEKSPATYTCLVEGMILDNAKIDTVIKAKAAEKIGVEVPGLGKPQIEKPSGPKMH